MKIYTKKGDNGKTQLLGGQTVSKNNLRIYAYGTIDELNSFVGNIYDQDISKNHKIILFKVQNHLFNIGSIIAYDGKKEKISIPKISNQNISMLENSIDVMEKDLPTLKNFILPSGHSIASLCHIARSVCRRAERHLVALSEKEEVDNLIIPYINRLSDYLFVMARFIIKEKGGQETSWQKDL